MGKQNWACKENELHPSVGHCWCGSTALLWDNHPFSHALPLTLITLPGFDVMVYITFLKHPEFWCIQHLNVTLSQLWSTLQLGDAAWGYSRQWMEKFHLPRWTFYQLSCVSGRNLKVSDSVLGSGFVSLCRLWMRVAPGLIQGSSYGLEFLLPVCMWPLCRYLPWSPLAGWHL